MMQPVVLPLGEDVFKNIILSNSYYIDKTKFIVDFYNSQAKVTLITRPRRFGKTILMTTLKEFFSIDGDKKLFNGLTISKYPEICQKWMNKFPVIFISFKGVEGRTYDISFARLKMYISYIAISLKYKIKQNKYDDIIADEDLKKIEKLSNPEEENPSDDLISESLFLFSKIYYCLYKIKTIILIDEYDVPLAKAKKFKYYDRYLDLMRSIFCQALKTNEYLNFAILTGCLKISKESIFAGLNNLVYRDISHKKFDDCCGFTNEEVQKILKDTNLLKYSDKIKEWYNGYIFGDNREIYCPWDVINYVHDLLDDSEFSPYNYWGDSGENRVIKNFLYFLDQNKINLIEKLLNFEYINVDIINNVTYDDINNKEYIWTFLYMTGYLTKLSKDRISIDNIYSDKTCLVIPNKEILSIFKNMIKKWNLSLVDNSSHEGIFLFFWEGKAKEAQDAFCKYLQKSVSFYDNVESFYHGFFLEFCDKTGLVVKSNRETEDGCYDVYIKNNQNSIMIIFELKWVKEQNKLDKYACIALHQILDKKYYSEFQDDCTKFLCYGIAFSNKKCSIKLHTIEV